MARWIGRFIDFVWKVFLVSQQKLVMKLTQVGNGAGGLFAADNFDVLGWRWWWAHLMIIHWVTRRHTIPVFVLSAVELSTILDNTELLDWLHFRMRFR